jgi:hypothetical protein
LGLLDAHEERLVPMETSTALVVTTSAESAVAPAGDQALIIFEDARRAIADADTVEQVNKILALATGLAAAARKATNHEMEAEAAVLKLEAERKLGQLMAAQKATAGFNKGGGDQRSDHRDSEKPGGLPTLAENGIDKNLAAKARRAAAMTEEQFETAKETKREDVLAPKTPRKPKPKTPRKPKPKTPRKPNQTDAAVTLLTAWQAASADERTKVLEQHEGVDGILKLLTKDMRDELMERVIGLIARSADHVGTGDDRMLLTYLTCGLHDVLRNPKNETLKIMVEKLAASKRSPNDLRLVFAKKGNGTA